MNQNIINVWTFRSDTNPNVEYQTLQYTDRSTSCNCRGWTRRVAPDGSRSCKHTRWVDLGTADRQCTATHNYNNHTHPVQTSQTLNHHANHQSKTVPQLGHRKFAL